MIAGNVKAAGLVAAGLVVSAAVVASALMWTWRGWCEPQFHRLEDGTEANAKSISQLEKTWRDQRDRDACDQTRRLDEIEAAVGDIRQQLKPLHLIKAVPEPLKKPRVPNSLAVLTPAELSGQTSADDPAHRLLAAVLVNGLVDLPPVRVTPVSAIADCKVRSQGKEKYPWSGAQEAGQVLGVQFVLTCTASEKRLGEFPLGQAELHLHVELISVETGALILGHDWVVSQSAGFRSEKPSWVGHVGPPLKEAARMVGKKIRLLELGPKLPAVLRGEVKPTSAAEQIGYAELCSAKKLYAASAQFYGDAFAVDPSLADDLEAMNRYNAACYAARAGCGQGADAGKTTEVERGRWRAKALEWLRADLALRSNQAGSGLAQDRKEVAARLEWWQKDSDLAGLREADALKRLPAEEAATWQGLWADVETLRQKCR